MSIPAYFINYKTTLFIFPLLIFLLTIFFFFIINSLTQQNYTSNLNSNNPFPLHQFHLRNYFSSFHPSNYYPNLHHHQEPLQESLSLSRSLSPSPSEITISTYPSPSNHEIFYGFLSNSSNFSSITKINVINDSGISAIDSTFIKVKSSLGKIEEGLAKAREEIRRAVRFNNVSSDGHYQDFIPRGSIYRNPYAFHQSVIEMEKRFKVWTYKEGDPPLFHDGPLNRIYASEGQFIDEMESGKNPFMARNPDEAHVYFLPFSVANVIRFVYKPITNNSKERLQRFTEDYITVLANRYPYWNRSNGADHFMVSCHDWSPHVSKANPELFRNFIRVLCNANTSEGFQPERDVTLPEINLPFGRLAQPARNIRPSQRTIFAFFAGGAHGYVRNVFLNHWKGKDDEIKVFQYLPKGLDYAKMMSQSKFCLCPSGYEVASPRVVESINAGCVPVIISDNYVLPFSDVLDWNKFSVYIPIKDIPKIKDILKSIPTRKYLQLQNKVREVQIHFTVNRPAKRFDVIHMVLHSVWLRRLNIGLIS